MLLSKNSRFYDKYDKNLHLNGEHTTQIEVIKK